MIDKLYLVENTAIVKILVDRIGRSDAYTAEESWGTTMLVPHDDVGDFVVVQHETLSAITRSSVGTIAFKLKKDAVNHAKKAQLSELEEQLSVTKSLVITLKQQIAVLKEQLK